MDGGSSSWLPFLGGGVGDGVSRQATNLSSSSCGSEVQQKQDSPITSQVEEQLRLQQFYMLMDMEKTGHPVPEVVPSSESSMFRSFSGSPDETSSFNPRSSNSNTTANKSCHHPAAEVSSQNIHLHSPYGGSDRHYDHQCYGNLDTILNQGEFNMCSQQEPMPATSAQHNNGGRVGAFIPYVRHLSPKKKPKPGSGGQRAIKAAISTLARLHMVRLAQWQQCYHQYQMEMALAAAPPAPPTAGGSNGDQQQHVLSERKRREKLNDSFKALRTALPPALKKEKDNKASILIRARDYVSTLETRVSELEEKNRMLLLELQHRRNNGGGGRGDVSRKKIKVDIDIDREAMPWML